MSSVIQAAAKGERSAMQSLYKANKQKVWCIAYGLLLDKAQAGAVTCAVFRDLWRELKKNAIPTKEKFTDAAVNKAAELCAASILQKNPKAFTLPYNKSFSLPAGIALDFHFESEPEYYLSNLPALQRLIFVLHTIGGWGALRIARVLQWDSSVIRTAIETEPEIFCQLQQSSGRNYTGSYEELLHLFAGWETETHIPASVDRSILDAIEALVSPQAELAKRRKISIAVFGAVVLLALLAVALRAVDFSFPGKDDTTQTTAATEAEEKETLPAPENTTVDPTAPYVPPRLDEDVTYFAELSIEDYGTIVIQLDHHAAPITCANFVELAELGYYDFLTIHSIIDGTMIQGGDPTIGGYMTSSRRIVGEFSANGYENPLSHTAGAISMVRGSEYDSAGSAFSLLLTDRTDMDGQYAVFGYVIEGMDVLETLCNSVSTDESGYIDEENQPVIDSLYIREEEREELEED